MREHDEKTVVRRAEKVVKGMRRIGLLVLGLAGYCCLMLAIAGFAAQGIDSGSVSTLNAILSVVVGMSVVNMLVNIAGL